MNDIVTGLSDSNISLIINIIVIGLWGIIGFFVLIHFLIGLKRGTKKSLYYTITSIILTVILLFITSLMSIRMFFPTIGSLTTFLMNRGLTLDDQILQLLFNPEVGPLVFVIIDILYKFIIFFLLYPIVKFILTVTLFRWIYKKYFDNSEENEMIAKKKSASSRLTGGFVGAVRGFIVGYIFLIPLILLIGATSGLTYRMDTSSNLNLSDESTTTNINAEEFNNMLDQISRLTNQTIVGMSKAIKVNDKSLDEMIFDFAFGGTIKYENNENKKVKLSRDLRALGEIANSVLEIGVLEQDFDYSNISHENDFKNIEDLFNRVAKLETANLGFSIGIDVLFEYLQSSGTLDLVDNPRTEKAHNMLKEISWNSEVSQLLNIVEKMLLIGDVGELEGYIKNYDTIFAENDEIKLSIIELVEELGNINLLKAAPILVEFSIQKEMLPEIANGEDYFEYYFDKLDFIYKNPQILMTDGGTIGLLSGLLTDILLDEDFDYDEFTKNNKFNLEYLLENDASAVVSALIQTFGSLEVLTKSLPIGIDYFLYSNINDESIDIAHKLSEIFTSGNFEELFENLDSVYKEVVTMSLNEYLGSGQNTTQLIDNILMEEENIISIKKIVNQIFIDSDVINKSLNLAAEYVSSIFIKDQNIQNFMQLLLSDDEFSVGKEIVTIFEVVEQLYQFTTIGDALDEDYMGILYDFGSLPTEHFETFKDTLFKLQTLSKIPNETLVSLVAMAGTNKIVVSSNATGKDLIDDLDTILNIAFSTSSSMIENGITKDTMKDAEISSYIDVEVLSSALNFDHIEKPDSILYHSLVNLFRTLNFEIPGFTTIKAPEELLDVDTVSAEWSNELNGLIQSIIKILAKKPNLDEGDVHLSFNSLTNFSSLGAEGSIGILNRLIQSLNEANIDNSNPLKPVDDLDRFLSTYTVHNLFNDAILGETIHKLMLDMLKATFNSDLENFSTLPEADQMDNGKIKVSEIKSLLLATQAIDLVKNGKIKFAISDVLLLSEDDDKFDQFFGSNYLRTMISRIILLDELKEKIATPAGFDPAELTLDKLDLDNNNNLSKLELKRLLKGFNALGITKFTDIELDNNILKDLLTDNAISVVLESNYLYQVIDLMLKKQLSNINIILPSDAFGNPYPNYISRNEIVLLLEALDVLGFSDPSEINSDQITIKNLNDLILKESIIMRAILSKELVNIITFPDESFESNDPSTNLIKQSELEAVLQAILILESDDTTLIKDIGLNNLTITVSQFNDLLAINASNGGSPFINRIISTAIIGASTSGLVIPDDAYVDSTTKLDITRIEIEKMSSLFTILNITTIGDPISTDTLNGLVLVQLVEEDSLIINKTISNQIISSNNNSIEIPDSAYIDAQTKEDLKPEEMIKLFKAINELNIELSNLSNFDPLLIDIQIIINAYDMDSVIISRGISKGLIDNSDFVNANNYIVINTNLLENDNKDISKEEIGKLLTNTRDTGFTNINHVIQVIGDPLNPVNIPIITTAFSAIQAMESDQRSQILIDSFMKALNL